MQMPMLDEQTRLSIEMAMTANRDDPLLRQRQNARAMQLGLSGAEIDAARAGRSFDLRRSRALALALGSPARRGGLRTRARQVGMCDAACLEIERLADRLSSRHQRQEGRHG